MLPRKQKCAVKHQQKCHQGGRLVASSKLKHTEKFKNLKYNTDLFTSPKDKLSFWAMRGINIKAQSWLLGCHVEFFV